MDSIGKGAFGEIYLVEKKLTKVQYAMKAERYIKNASNPVLPKEAKIMKNLRNKGVDAIPTIHHFGQETASDGKTMMFRLAAPSFAVVQAARSQSSAHADGFKQKLIDSQVKIGC